MEQEAFEPNNSSFLETGKQNFAKIKQAQTPKVPSQI